MLKQFESDFKGTSNWNKDRSKKKKKKSIAKHIFKFFNCPSFEGVNRVFGSSVENQEDNKN